MFANIKINGNIQNALDKIKRKLFKTTEIQVGISEDEKYDDGTPVVLVARVHEYGSIERNIPARPFMRAGAKKFAKSKWAKLLKRYKLDKMDNGLKTLSDVMVKDMQGFILRKQGGFIPLKPLTVARKGNDVPLYDTGKLVKSIKAVIKK